MSPRSPLPPPSCDPALHGERPATRHGQPAFDRAVGIFRALGDEPRLRLLEVLVRGEACVSELAELSGESISTVSHRLRLLRGESLVARRKEGRHCFYAIADGHVTDLVLNALDHASETQAAGPRAAAPSWGPQARRGRGHRAG